MDDKARIEELIRENARLCLENSQMLRALQRFAAQQQPRATTPLEYMSGRWHRRSGDVYGVSIQSAGVTDANSPSGNLRSTD